MDPFTNSIIRLEFDAEFLAESWDVDVFVVAGMDLDDVGDQRRRADEGFEVMQDGEGGVVGYFFEVGGGEAFGSGRWDNQVGYEAGFDCGVEGDHLDRVTEGSQMLEAMFETTNRY